MFVVTAESQYLQVLARRMVAAVLDRIPIEAAVLAGSAGRGNADRFSDLDILFYVDAIPTDEALGAIRGAVDGVDPVRREEPSEDFLAEEFRLSGVRTELAFFTVQPIERQLDRLLDELEDVVSPWQKLLSGIDEAMPLYGDALVARWKARLRPFPEPFRRAMIEGHWNFFALWYYGEAMAARDSELWRLDVLLDGAFNLLGALAGLNRLYFARFELKRTRELTARMPIAPPDIADRIEALFTTPPAEAATSYGALIEEARELIHRELPDLNLELPRPLACRQTQWPMPAPPQTRT